jgi:hypothetical protein
LMPGRGQQALGSYDPNTPFMETNNEVVEISSAPVDASVFEIPGDYTATSLSDLLKASRPPVQPNANIPGYPHRLPPHPDRCSHRLIRFVFGQSPDPRILRRAPFFGDLAVGGIA